VNGLSVGLKIVLPFEEAPNPHQDIAVHFICFAARKVTFCKYSRPFVVMPGGLGTLDELFEVLMLVQTGKMPAVPVLLPGAEFWGGLVAWLKSAMLSRKLISAIDVDRRIQVVNTLESAMTVITAACLVAPAAAIARAPASVLVPAL
jgi:uncharacterized protein (TIGR00730 family)